MKDSRHLIKASAALLAVAVLLLSSPAPSGAQDPAPEKVQAGEEVRARYHREPEAVGMIIDGLVVRPVSLVATLVGGVIYVVTLPFSALSGNLDEAGEKLVVGPAEYTFTRCLGCFHELP